jgi:hypothetical protein
MKGAQWKNQTGCFHLMVLTLTRNVVPVTVIYDEYPYEVFI